MRNLIAVTCLALVGGLAHGQEKELLPLPEPEKLPLKDPPRNPPTLEVIPGMGVIVTHRNGGRGDAEIDRIIRLIKGLPTHDNAGNPFGAAFPAMGGGFVPGGGGFGPGGGGAFKGGGAGIPIPPPAAPGKKAKEIIPGLGIIIGRNGPRLQNLATPDNDGKAIDANVFAPPAGFTPGHFGTSSRLEAARVAPKMPVPEGRALPYGRAK